MKFVRLVAALSAAAMLTACTSAPVATVSPPPLAATYANADLAASGPAADTGAWWHGFHDPILDRLVDTALANNLDLQAAVPRVGVLGKDVQDQLGAVEHREFRQRGDVAELGW